MTKKDIKNSIDNIREECDNIEEEVEDKNVSTRGDPIVRFN